MMRDLLESHALLGWWLALGAASLLILWQVKARAAVWLVGRRRARRQRRASRAEAAAARLLERHGFTIVEEQARRTWAMAVDDEVLEITVIADYLVEAADGHRLVAEVKSGEQAPDLKNAATRRQLLEYALAYASPVVLLVDMRAMAVRRVDVFDTIDRLTRQSSDRLR